MESSGERLFGRLAFYCATVLGCTALAFLMPLPSRADDAAGIEAVKSSIIAVGTFEKMRSPAFRFLGTGFAVGDGSLVATNAHVIPDALNMKHLEVLVVAKRTKDQKLEIRGARKAAVDLDHDLALLKIDGPPMRPLGLGDSDSVREGDSYLFTGFPLGSALGLVPVTHRAMVSAVTPIATPGNSDNELDAKLVRRLSSGAFAVYQLDGTAYPGNSGSPLYSPQTMAVIGIINMVFVKGTKENALSHPSGITYAIPASYLRALLAQAR